MTRRAVCGAVVGILCWTHVARAVIPVEDLLNFGVNQHTALQTTLTTLEAVLHTGYWLLDLEPFGSTGVEGIEGDLDLLAELGALLGEIDALRRDFARLFSLESAVDNSYDLNRRLGEIRRQRADARRRAAEIQSLPARVGRMVERAKRILGRILAITGDNQGSQQVQASLQQLTQVEAQTQILVASWQHVALSDTMEDPMVEESMRLINEQLLADWPK